MEEVAKTSELKDSLQCEVHELRNNLENVTREVADKAASNDRLAGELAQLQHSIDQISKDKNSISDSKQVIEKELEDATKKYGLGSSIFQKIVKIDVKPVASPLTYNKS